MELIKNIKISFYNENCILVSKNTMGTCYFKHPGYDKENEFHELTENFLIEDENNYLMNWIIETEFIEKWVVK